MGKTAQDVLNVMRSWLGYNEVNGKFRQIIDLYNSVKPLPRGYAVQYHDEWCDTTVSAAGIKAGCSDLIGRECGCEQHVKIFQSMGIWIENGTIVPKPGDIILYNWDQSYQPNNGYSDHIGFVESVSNGQITCIEGNKGEAVARRVLSVGNGNIRGMKIYLRVNPFCISVLKSSLNPKAPKMLTKNKVLISKQFVPTFSKLPETMPMIRVISPTIAYWIA